MNASDIMVSNVITVSVNADVREAAKVLLDNPALSRLSGKLTAGRKNLYAFDQPENRSGAIETG